MKNFLHKIDRRFQLTRPGSVLILVVALLVLMALIGTAFLSTQRVDRYNVLQNTNNTEIDLLVEGVKNMAKATIVGSLSDPSLPFPYRPANSTLAKNWDAYDLYHQYTDNPLIGTTPNDAWLSPRCPVFLTTNMAPTNNSVVWQCIGEPLTGNVFESPFVLGASGTGNQSLPGVSLTYHDRVSYGFVPKTTGEAVPTGNNPAVGVANPLTPTFATISYPDGTSASFPAFTLAVGAGTYTFLAGDADGDGIADCGMFKLPIGQVNGITYYAGVRIIDNNSAVNVNTAMSRRFDFSGNTNATLQPTRSVNGAAVTWNGIFNLSCFESNVGLAELLQTYNGAYPNSGTATSGLGTEFGAWLYYHLGDQSIISAVPSAASPSNGTVTLAGSGTNLLPVPIEGDVVPVAGQAAANSPNTDYNGTIAPFPGFSFTTLGDMLTNQVGRRPGNPGYAASGVQCLAATDTDAASLAYHFVFENPHAAPSIVEQILHSSLVDSAPNGEVGPPNRPTNAFPEQGGGAFSSATLLAAGAYPAVGASSYTGNASNATSVVNAWYQDNFDWSGDTTGGVAESCMNTGSFLAANAGASFLPRRSLFTADSATSNLVPRPLLPTTAPSTYTAGPQTLTVTPTQAASSNPSYTVWTGVAPNMYPTGMSPIYSTLCKTSINTAPFADLWRAFWLSMAADGGLSPLGTNTDPTTNYPLGTDGVTPLFDHNLVQGQSIYTGMQFNNLGDLANNTNPVQPQAETFQSTGAQHPQAMFRSVLRDPYNVYYNTPVGARTDSYIEADQMVLLRSAIAAANATAMRWPVKANPTPNAAPIFAYDIPLKAQVASAIPGQPSSPQTVYARVFGVTQQPYITQVYASTDTKTPGFTEPYVAIQLFNPYNTAIDLTGWQLSTVDRDPTAAGTARGLNPIYNFSGQSVPANGYALLEDYDYGGSSSGTVPSRPPGATSQTTGQYTKGVKSSAPFNDYYVPALASVIPLTTGGGYANQEVMLMRPAFAGEATDEVPVDSYDFTGLRCGHTDPTTGTQLADNWHYARASMISPDGNNDSLWRFIYPGRYDASDPMPYTMTGTAVAVSTVTPAVPNTGTSSIANEPHAVTAPPAYTTYSRRQQGTQAEYVFLPNSTPQTSDPWYNSQNEIGDGTFASTYPITFPFQYLNNDEPGPGNINPPATQPAGGPALYPFGQFARSSDMLQVPFVGSYIIFSSPPTGFPVSGAVTLGVTAANIIELNPMPMDCSFAEDTDISDDPPGNDSNTSNVSSTFNIYTWNESVGHFAPVNVDVTTPPPTPTDNAVRQNTGTPPPTFPVNQSIADSDPTLAYTSNTSTADPYAAYKVQYTGDSSTQRYWRYHWASRLFDYLTVQNPNDDYLPNVSQSLYPTFIGSQPVPVQNTSSISPAASYTPDTPYTEDTVPVYGLININTAPWRVLSALRLCAYDDAETPLSDQIGFNGAAPGDTIPDNVDLAQALVDWRDRAGTGTSSQVSSPSFPYTTYKGPFTSISDLVNVPVIQAYLNNIFLNPGSKKGPTGPDAVQGALSPFNFYGTSPVPSPLNTSLVRNDVEERYVLLDRLSNQITTKSDVYTVYIVVQGWQNAGSTSASNPPKMVTQRRAAFIIDRTGVTPTSSNVKIINVPTD